MNKLRPLVIGNLTAERPVIQGGMGVGISLSSLAGSVAKAGGIGLISSAQIGFREPDFKTNPIEANLRAIKIELDKARKIAPKGIIGFNIMVATKGYADYVKAAVRAGADLIVSGAGLPVSLPGLLEEVRNEAGAVVKTKIAPIVSTAKSAMVICKMWDRKFNTIPDLVVIEGPLAGGHLGFSLEDLHRYGADTEEVSKTYKKADYEEEVKEIIKVVHEYADKYGKKIPVVTAGGIYTHEDVVRQFELGADGVQVGTRFVTTEECDAPFTYKQAYLNAKEEDIVITKSPVGMPGRAIKNDFLKEIGTRPFQLKACYLCLEKCDKKNIPYCITQALIDAAEGHTEESLLFCGSNACRADHMETVETVMEDLCENITNA